MNSDNKMTKRGLGELEQELKRKKQVERKNIAGEIDRAREQGDLSENAAYKAALEKKEFNENRIEELEKMVASAVIVQANSKNKKVELGETVSVKRESDEEQVDYILVGENETDPSKNKISTGSPIGKELIGKEKGDRITVSMPSGEENFEIIDIQ